ncbi:Ssl1-like-domain-containing protein [Dunaliella salina]|uniref:Ssl1-like-domain-containing protein n=1 Tax=Dunaliella salina TaxID=3046 RepID=A0ABQ7H4U2_DUNSA|nr:Ssl1-like-domain-containing protein [Dunaliella salina]|eukprot:KAF5841880.1 Ssl1-like-domain-containing protein [Dunaliella salina]
MTLRKSATGAVSLQNALDTGVALLRNIPPYGHREMLVLFAALSTCDPGNIFDSIKEAKAAKIRVSLVGVAAEVHVCRRMTQETGGSYGIALNETHLSDLLLAHAPPPPALAGNTGAELVCMGFPDKGPDAPASAVFVGAEARLCAGGYVCPRCAARVAELPGECHVCALTLISSPHLARSYHHLFPVPRYDELQPEQVFDLIGIQQQQLQDSHHTAAAQMQGEQQHGKGVADGLKGLETKHQGLKHKREGGVKGPPMKKQCVTKDGGSGAGSGLLGLQGIGEVPHALYCFGCLLDLAPPAVNRVQLQGRPGPPPPMVLQCPQCKHTFCFECDAYVHEQLHNCPGCECAQQQQSLQGQAAAEGGIS